MVVLRNGLAVLGAAVLTLSMTGCSHKSSTSGSHAAKAVSSATSSAKATSGSKSSTSPMASGTSTKGAGHSRAGHESCTTATIGGHSKCIEVGQMCSKAHVADYPKYGFTCTADGKRYVLRKA